MIRLNNQPRENLTREEIQNIKKASAAKKMRFQLLRGFKSLFKNPLKLGATIIFIVLSIILFISIEPLLLLVPILENNWVAMAVKVFKLVIPFVESTLFLGLLYLLGHIHKWGKKIENACISSGIYTKARKAPFAIDRYKDKETSLIALEIYLNGNTADDFTENKAQLESELEMGIDITPKGKSRIILLISPDKTTPKKHNSEDKIFGRMP